MYRRCVDPALQSKTFHNVYILFFIILLEFIIYLHVHICTCIEHYTWFIYYIHARCLVGIIDNNRHDDNS